MEFAAENDYFSDGQKGAAGRLMVEVKAAREMLDKIRDSRQKDNSGGFYLRMEIADAVKEMADRADEMERILLEIEKAEQASQEGQEWGDRESYLTRVKGEIDRMKKHFVKGVNLEELVKVRVNAVDIFREWAVKNPAVAIRLDADDPLLQKKMVYVEQLDRVFGQMVEDVEKAGGTRINVTMADASDGRVRMTLEGQGLSDKDFSYTGVEILRRIDAAVEKDDSAPSKDKITLTFTVPHIDKDAVRLGIIHDAKGLAGAAGGWLNRLAKTIGSLPGIRPMRDLLNG
jgi:hypothetical protein